MRLILFLFIIFCFCGCDTPPENGALYFDIPGFIDKEIIRLGEKAHTLKKNLLYEKKEEQQLIENPDWKTELKPFFETNLNKPAYAGRFKLDSSFAGDTLKISYTSTNNKSDLQLAEVYYFKQEPVKISVLFTEKNALYNSNKKLVYVCDSFFEITGEQRLRLSSLSNYRVRGIIGKP